MKALSVRAPWWWFILHGGKDIENRDWHTGFRGDVLIHASKWWGQQDVLDDAYCAVQIARSPFGLDLNRCHAMGGCLVGKVTIVDCVLESKSPWFFGTYGFVLENPVAFARPIQFKGALSFFDVPDGLIGDAA